MSGKRKAEDSDASDAEERFVPESAPAWLKTISQEKLEELWKSSGRPFFPSLSAASHVRIYGHARFLAEHRDAILFEADMQHDERWLEKSLATEKARDDRLALRRVLLRIQRDGRTVGNAFLTANKRWIQAENTHRHVADLVAFVVESVSTGRVLFRLKNATLPAAPLSYLLVREARLQHVSWSSFNDARPLMQLNPKEHKRCLRLDAIEVTICGAEHEAAHARWLDDTSDAPSRARGAPSLVRARARRIDRAWEAPPIAHFVMSTLYDKNLWGLITALL